LHDLKAVSCLLFVPANRPDRFGKALAASPEGIIVDLEDAVAPADKDAARAAAARFLAERPAGGPAILLRVNGAETQAGLRDLLALAEGGLAPDGIVLPKVEAERDVALLRAHLGEGQRPILALLETARGIGAAQAIAAALRPQDGLGMGGVDLSADTGAALAWESQLVARSLLVMAARRRVALFDMPWLAIRDPEGLAEETRRVRGLGFSGKLAIHPDQVAAIRAGFVPSEAEIAHAQKVLAALAADGVASVDGAMVDAPVAAMARQTLVRAGVRP
jgi:(S)-citramalyl-CoA lyase